MTMRKLISFIILTGMLLFLGLGQPATIAQAASGSESDSELTQASRNIIHPERFDGHIVPPNTIYYNDGT